VVVPFSDNRLTIEGRNLQKLRKYVKDHNASEVRESDRDFAEEKETVVESISMAKKPG